MKKTFALIILTLTLNSCGFEIVDTGYRGVETRFGQVVGEPLPEGLHFYNPFTTGITEYLVQENTWEDQTIAFTKDTQNVKITFAVTYYPNPLQVHTLFKEIGRTYELEQKIIKPTILGSLKDAIGAVIADELVSKREVVTKSALEEVRAALEKRHVIITSLQFTNLDFDDAYERAVEEKVVAIQMANKAKNDSVRIKEEAAQKIMTANAEAESMKIKTQALSQSQSLVDFEAVQKWDGKLPQYILGSGAMPFINLEKLGKK